VHVGCNRRNRDSGVHQGRPSADDSAPVDESAGNLDDTILRRAQAGRLDVDHAVALRKHAATIGQLPANSMAVCPEPTAYLSVMKPFTLSSWSGPTIGDTVDVPRWGKVAVSGGYRSKAAALDRFLSEKAASVKRSLPFRLAVQTWTNYQRHNAQWLAAALAYFAAFAVAPLIIVVVAIAGLFIHNHQSTLNAIYEHLPGPSMVAVRQIVAGTLDQPRHSVIAQVAGSAVFVVAAIGLLSALQFALNTVWEVAPKKLGIAQRMKERALVFAMMLALALLLMLSVLANAALGLASSHFGLSISGPAALAKTGDFALSVALSWLFFVLLFKYLPDARIAWRDVWLGAGLTALLFVGGQLLLGWYLGGAGVSSAYGAFGSLVVFLLWANYSSQILLLGAEFTHAYGQRDD
jgi:membrane protein